jgi:hypothetical protein
MLLAFPHLQSAACNATVGCFGEAAVRLHMPALPTGNEMPARSCSEAVIHVGEYRELWGEVAAHWLSPISGVASQRQERQR